MRSAATVLPLYYMTICDVESYIVLYGWDQHAINKLYYGSYIQYYPHTESLLVYLDRSI